ncbi:hypothetical protein FG386_002741 [Cryptosporidium ryanae]|uniref:uncharacterized protein n=1 Tax=Cryptosporidium ryanae TaxID=515981 RepID=UPI00351A0342|nr:hypothetical protein FG386_002741 [Cryptosporidium ryanae]
MDIGDVGRILISVSKKVKKTASQIVNPLTPLEKLLKEATSNTNWGCSSTILNEISRSMVDYHDYIVVQHCICDCLNQKPSKWRKIYKTLILIEYLLKNGLERFIDDTKENIYRIRSLQDFYYNEEGRDKGAGIRDKSKYILNLLNDPLVLKNERKKAKENRSKYIGINSRCGNTVSNAGNYGSRSSNGVTGGVVGFGHTRSEKSSGGYYSHSYDGTNNNYRNELYDPYKPQQQFNGCIEYKNNRNINDNASCSSLSSQTFPPLPSSLNSNNKNSGIIRINNAYNSNTMTRSRNTEPDKHILAATNRLTRQDERNISNNNNNNPFEQDFENNNDKDNQFTSEWCDFIGASNNNVIEKTTDKTSNPFSIDFVNEKEEETVTNYSRNQSETTNKKKIMESLDLLDMLSLSNNNSKVHSFKCGYTENEDNNSNGNDGGSSSNNNVHIPFGF